MLLPALVVLAGGELTSDQVGWVRETLQLENAPRTEGPGEEGSIAHRTFHDDEGNRLVLDLVQLDEEGWVFGLFFAEEPPSSGIVEAHRTLLRGIVERLGLRIIQITPAATADEVFVMPSESPENPEEDTLGVSSWELPYQELDQMWMHVGLRRDAPREVKAVKLREVMRTPAWSVAPEKLRRQAEEFLRSL